MSVHENHLQGQLKSGMGLGAEELRDTHVCVLMQEVWSFRRSRGHGIISQRIPGVVGGESVRTAGAVQLRNSPCHPMLSSPFSRFHDRGAERDGLSN